MNVHIKLTLYSPQGGETYFELAEDNICIGRLESVNRIALHDEKASRKHAVLEKKDNSYLITDQNSTNGTIVNGSKLKEGGRLLKDGDEILIGSHKMIFNILHVDDEPLTGTVYLKSAADLLTSPTSHLSATSATSNLTKLSSASVRRQPSTIDQSILSDIDLLVKRSRILEYIYELNKLFSSAFTVGTIYEKVAEQIFKVTNAGRVVFILSKDDAIEIQWQEFREKSLKQEYEGIPISRTIVKKAIEDRVSLLVDPLSGSSSVGNKTSALQKGKVRSLICSPMLVKEGRAMGAIYADSTEVIRFTDEDLDFLTVAAGTAATAIDKIFVQEELMHEAEIRSAYRRFLPSFVIDQVMSDPNSVELGGVSQKVTMLFADIRGFTTLSERKTPKEIVALLNIYFERAATEIFRHKGALDKFMGDGIMALFGAPKPLEEDPINAVNTAIALQNIVEDLNKELTAQGADFDLKIGVGINTGDVIAGYIGSQLRTDYTVIGDAVNVAARLESNAKGGQILMGEETRAQILNFVINNKVGFEDQNGVCVLENNLNPNGFIIQSLGGRKVKGKNQPVEVYEVVWN